MDKEKEEQELVDKNVNPDVENLQDTAVDPITYDVLMNNVLKFSQNVGQLVWVDEKEEGVSADKSIDNNSNKINVVRFLSDGKKQLFSIVVTEESEIKMKN